MIQGGIGKRSASTGGNWNNTMEQMFILGSIDGWNQHFYKLKLQVLQLNGAGHFKKRISLLHKVWSHVWYFCWNISPGEKPGGNVMSGIFGFRGQTIDEYYQVLIDLKDLGLHGE